MNGGYYTPWHFFEIAPTAVIGNEPDVRKFSQMAALSAQLTSMTGEQTVIFADAANARIEPKLPDAARRSNGSNARETGRSVIVRYAYS